MFGTSGIRGELGREVTADLAVRVGRAVASEDAHRVVVGRDPRVGGDLLADAVGAGLRECGADVVRLGVTATPTLARAVGWEDADAGVMVTASHNPPEDNGFKLWNPSGMAFDEAQRTAVARRIEEEDVALVGYERVGETETADDATDRHADVLGAAAGPLSGLDVVVDAGNGAGLVTVEGLTRAGADVTALNAQPDGRFPGRPSEPTAETTADLQALVAATDADLGVAHDGDADRMMAVDETGEFVGGDVLLGLFARTVAGEGDRVSAPVNASLAVDDALAERGAAVVRTRVGDVFVAERAMRDDVAFGGEPSGAWIWPDETLCPDGPLAAAKLARLVREEGPLSTLVAGVDGYPIRRDSVDAPRKERLMDRVAAAVEDAYDDVETTDGVRVDLGDGWFLVRASGTQSLVRVTAEAREEARADEIFEEARALVEDARAVTN